MNINIKLKRSDRFHFTLDNNNLTYATSQKVEIIEYFSKLLLEENFDYIIELGTHKGGFSIILDEIKKENKL